ncbi:MAG: gluconeogenesis factor YvcK family protein [Nanoarchaeota archaeon]|nr:gluconeogenesis factor YvcK family protein [Nanoarchaeota archaeon]
MKKIVVIGGGTGSYTVLRGLKKFSKYDLTAIIAMFDSGASTGMLRDEYGILPPGDIRKALTALGDTSLMRKIFKYRFSKTDKHSLGNLMLTALGDIAGDEAEGYKLASKLLNVQGRVLPVTTDHCHFNAELFDGRVLKGESNFNFPVSSPIKKIWLEPKSIIYEDARNAIEDADLIVIGPGSLYTSVCCNFLVEGFAEAIRKSKAKKVYVCNIMTQLSETDGMSVVEHVSVVESFLGENVLDYVIVNSKRPSNELLEKYKQEDAYFVIDDSEELNYNIIRANLLYEPDLIRHNREKLARLVLELAEVEK